MSDTHPALGYDKGMIVIFDRKGLSQLLTLELDTLRNVELRGANLENANLVQVDLENADLREANLVGADLRLANLRGADLRGANLTGTDFAGAAMDGALTDKPLLPVSQ